MQRAGSTNSIILYDHSKEPPYNVIDTIKQYKKKKSSVYLIDLKYLIFIDVTQNAVTVNEGIEHVPSDMKGDFESINN
ncbi:hypothetical protein YSY43_31410 [Paenibacillus sp. YSY-4.3]